MKNILITGGAGFIGSNLVHYIQQESLIISEPTKITVLDALTYAAKISNLSKLPSPELFTFVRGDVRDPILVDKLIKDCDAVFHLAAESHVDRSIVNPQIFVDTNIRGTLNILEAARNYNKRIVLVSTDEVYGSLDSGFADENTRLDPSSPYSASKASADLLALAFYKTFGLNVIITRCSNNYGPRQFPEKLIPQTIKKILAQSRIPIYGQGLNMRDWIHVDDHCSGLYKSLLLGEPGEIYNFGDVDKLTNIDLVKNILLIMNESEELIQFVDDRLGHDFRYAIDASKAKKELGWNPKKSISNSLNSVIDWYIKN